jgi:hypothetical protein
MAVKIKYDRNAWRRGLTEAQQRMARAATKAYREGAKEIQRDGQAELARIVGPSNAKWFFARAKPKGGYSLRPSLRGYRRKQFLNIFERGGTIEPLRKKYLWLPLSHVVQRVSRTRLTPRFYERRFGKLQFVKRPGKAPLLLGDVAAGRGGRASTGKITTARLKRGKDARSAGRATRKVPVFVGVDSVTIHQRLNFQQIYSQMAQYLPELYRRMMALEGNK